MDFKRLNISTEEKNFEYPKFQYIEEKGKRFEEEKFRTLIKDDIITLYQLCLERNFDGVITFDSHLILKSKISIYDKIIKEELKKINHSEKVIRFEWKEWNNHYSFVKLIYYNE